MRARLALPIAVAALALTAACTPEEAKHWLAWHASDPDAAQAWLASPEGQESLIPEPEVPHDEAPASPTRGGCDGIYDELIRQGASDGVAQRLAYRIAPRESGCSPQQVHDGDDWSYSRFGLNGITAQLRNNWMAWCGADVRYDTADLATDVACALAAYDRMGWAPWS